LNTLKDKVAIITGSTRGIGRAIAKRFSSEGAKVVINGLRSIDEAKKVVREIEENGGSAIEVMADASDEKGVDEIIRRAMEQYHRIDVAVCSVGKHEEFFALDASLEDWQRMININLTSTFLTSKKVAEVMKKQNSGKIITVSSKMGIVGAGKSSAYCTAKAGVVMLTKILAVELAQYGIQVNGIAPGVTETDPTFVRFAEEPEIEERTNKRIPLRRIANPNEIAAAAVFLASDDSSYVNGSILVVDGGWIANGDYF
jgi:NAD(P)-dependent dehydrogenase (short-subunit alcohol dehydrogenase family)